MRSDDEPDGLKRYLRTTWRLGKRWAACRDGDCRMLGAAM